MLLGKGFVNLLIYFVLLVLACGLLAIACQFGG